MFSSNKGLAYQIQISRVAYLLSSPLSHTHTYARIITHLMYNAGWSWVYVTYFFSPLLIDARVTVWSLQSCSISATPFLLIRDRVNLFAVKLSEPLRNVQLVEWMRRMGTDSHLLYIRDFNDARRARAVRDLCWLASTRLIIIHNCALDSALALFRNNPSRNVKNCMFCCFWWG